MANLRANQASEALIQYESGQELVAMQQMDQDSRKLFSISDTPWSDAPGKEPDIKPDGMLTDGAITPEGTDDTVTVATGTANQAGVKITVVTADLVIDRSDTGLDMDGTNDHAIASVVVDSGGAYALVEGTPGTAFSETRDAAGGPPLIPQGQIEVGQIRLSSETSAVIASSEIFQVENTHKEMALVPTWTEDYAEGEVEFISNLPEIHADDGDGNKTKQVYAEVYTPMFANLEPASDFVPIETTHSTTSTEVYGGAIGASSSSLGQATFTVYLRDGVTDPLIALKNTRMWVKFFPHRLRSPYMLTLGTLGISRTFPAGDNMQAACTLTGNMPTVEVSS